MDILKNINNTESLLDNLPGAILLLNKNLKILYANHEFFALTGIKKDKSFDADITILNINSPQDKNQCLIECLRQNKEINNNFIINSNNEPKKVFIKTKIFNDYFIVSMIDTAILTQCDAGYEYGNSKLEVLQNKIIGKDKNILSLYDSIILASDSLANVLINGESGTGKELVAEAIHELSDRKSNPFITVNCSALSESLLESELFGHVKGSFTGAIKDKIGKFEMSRGGTVFLDEIGDISPLIQLKLLRVIQEKTISRVGDNKEIKVDMRIICATNKNLRELIAAGNFREDLFYRLNVYQIHTTPLRERISDIPYLSEYFINKYNQDTGKKISGFSENALRLFIDYCWPGNVRELQNAIEHSFVVCKDSLIDIFDLPQELRQAAFREGICERIKISTAIKNTPSFETYKPEAKKIIPRNTISKEKLIETLASNNSNKAETARQLGISRIALWKKIKKFEIE